MSAAVHPFPNGVDGERILADKARSDSHDGVGRGLIERAIETLDAFVREYLQIQLAGWQVSQISGRPMAKACLVRFHLIRIAC